MSTSKIGHPLRSRFARFARDPRGSISVLTVVTMVPFVVAAGTAVDMGRANRTIGLMQTAVDSAALAAAATQLSVTNSEGQTLSGNDAKTYAANQMVEANLPDEVKTTAEDPVVTIAGDVVTVDLEAEMATSFMKLVGLDTMSLSVSATAEATVKANGCIVALGPNGDGIEVGGTVDLEVDGCWLYSNKEGDKSIDVIGGAIVDAPGSCSVGSTSVSSNAQVHDKRYTNCHPIADPFAEWAPPVPPSSCDHNKFKKSSSGNDKTITLSPGRYCGGLQLSGYDYVDLEPGIYHVTSGALSINSKVTLTGEGVGFHIGADVSSVTINGDATVSLSAPTDGPMKGVLVSMDPLPSGTELDKNELISAKINGGSELGLSGTVYLPSAALDVSGNSTTLSVPTQIIAYSVKLSGTSALKVEVPVDEFGNPIGSEFMTIVRLIK